MEELTLVGRLLGVAGGAAVGIVFFFVCLANYVLRRKIIHLVEVMIFTFVTLDFMMRTFNILNPATVDSGMLIISTMIIRLVFVILVIVWGVMLAKNKWTEVQAMEVARLAALAAEREKAEHERLAAEQQQDSPASGN